VGAIGGNRRISTPYHVGTRGAVSLFQYQLHLAWTYSRIGRRRSFYCRNGEILLNQNAGGLVTKFNPKSGEIGPISMGPPLFWNTAIATGRDGSVFVNNMWTGEILEIEDGNVRIIAELPAALDREPDLGYMTVAEGIILAAHLGRDVIYAVDPGTGFFKVILGKDGEAGYRNGDYRSALLDDPIGMDYDPKSKTLWFTDGKDGAKRLRRFGQMVSSELFDFDRNPIASVMADFSDEAAVVITFRSTKKGTAIMAVHDEKDEKRMEMPVDVKEGTNAVTLDLSETEGNVFFISLSYNYFTRIFEYDTGR